ncbi:hypothetical protein BY996DRAFT_3961436 [Phakopsora pachyrhizi]|uniref:Expressed protein n=1 Tax=Phakopsora pachyrhizi TaxID=170000 RepID=A0AAV0B4K8_PHAPC|nr:hypothetical protein BY996DRAFT_3961436 [Phakopsora pachyrhizi]CAH7677073.1 expressed protein [Phakopsora pachyrhizi]
MSATEPQTDSLSAAAPNSRRHIKLLSSFGRTSGRKLKNLTLARTDSSSKPNRKLYILAPPSIPLPSTPDPTITVWPPNQDKITENSSLSPHNNNLVAAKIEPSVKHEEALDVEQESSAISHSPRLSRVFVSLKGKSGSLNPRLLRPRADALFSHPSSDEIKQLRLHGQFSTNFPSKAGKLLGIYNQSFLDQEVALELTSDDKSINSDMTTENNNSSDCEQDTSEARPISFEIANHSLDDEYPYLESPTFSEIENIFEASFGPCQASAQSFFTFHQSSPSINSGSNYAPSTVNSSMPATPTSLVGLERVSMPQIVCPEDREAYRNSCMDLLGSLKAIDELAKVVVKEELQPKLAEEVEEWEVRLRSWDKLNNEQSGYNL